MDELQLYFGVLMCVCVTVIMAFAQQCLLALLPLRRSSYHRELSSSMYSVLPEYFAYLTAQSLLIFLESVLGGNTVCSEFNF